VASRKIKVDKHLLVIISAWVSRLVAILCYFVSIRVLLTNLGTLEFSVFVLLSSLISWFSLFDFGVGYSLQNTISEKKVKSENYTSLVASSVLVMFVIFICISIILYFVSSYISIAYLVKFNISEQKKFSYFFLNGVLLLGIGFGAIGFKVLYAEFKGYWSNIIQASAAVLSLTLIYFSNRYFDFKDKLLWNLFFYNLPLAILSLTITLNYIFKLETKKKLQINEVKKLFNKAKKFWIFALLSTFVLGIDYIVISQYLAPKEIVGYNISTKILSQIIFVYNAVLMAIWPVSSEAGYKKEWDKIKNYIKKSLFFGAILVIFTIFILFFFMNNIIDILGAGKDIKLTNSFIAFLCLYLVLRLWTDTYAIILQSLSIFNYFWIYVPLQAIINVILLFILVPKMGLNGVLLSLIISFLFTVSWALPLNFYRYIKSNGPAV
jgi:O-antigen/teichoic acid export membrane protein